MATAEPPRGSTFCAVTVESEVRERVGRLLGEYLDNAAVDPTEAPVAIRAGTAVVQVRLIDADPPVVRVFSALLRRVEVSPELLTELNEINAHLSFVRLFWRDGAVLAATELLAATIDPNELANACDVLCDVADYYDVQLHQRFGGDLSFDG
jgi:T3SS (YopN, CesT) and YbjN peptide-binding chaperone 1